MELPGGVPHLVAILADDGELAAAVGSRAEPRAALHGVHNPLQPRVRRGVGWEKQSSVRTRVLRLSPQKPTGSRCVFHRRCLTRRCLTLVATARQRL